MIASSLLASDWPVNDAMADWLHMPTRTISDPIGAAPVQPVAWVTAKEVDFPHGSLAAGLMVANLGPKSVTGFAKARSAQTMSRKDGLFGCRAGSPLSL